MGPCSVGTRYKRGYSRHHNRMRRNGLKLHQGRFRLDIGKKCLYCKSGRMLDRATQGGGGVPSLGGVQKTSGCGTSGDGLAGMVVVGWRLDLMILEVFSNLNDSRIL